MEALGTLAGGVAHDFNNIVAAIIGNVELALDDVPADSPARTSLMEIRKASRRARDLVQQILAFSRRQVLERQVIELAPVVEESVRLLRATLPAGVEPEPAHRRGRAPRAGRRHPDRTGPAQPLHQRLAGGSRCCARTCRGPAGGAPRQPCCAAQRHGPMAPTAWARLTVRDNGQGMSDETRARMFEPFFTTKPPGKGTGLGLAVVHGILRDHDAVLEVQSAPGEGSTFSVYLPAVAGTSSPCAEPMCTSGAPRAHCRAAGGPHPVRGRRRDDRLPDGAPAAARGLSGHGVHARGPGAGRGSRPRRAVRPRHHRLQHARHVGARICARGAGNCSPDSPVAITSGYISEELRAQAPAAGVSELIYKPNTVEELFAAVDRLARTVLRPPSR